MTDLRATSVSQVLGASPRSAQAVSRDALSRLLAFSDAHAGAVAFLPQAAADQPGVRFDLVSRSILLWKVYAKEQKVEVLTGAYEALAPQELAEFRSRWRRIPGKAGALENLKETPSLPLKSLADDRIWTALEDCLSWAVRLS